MIDCHVHSLHSGDSPAAVRAMCVRAVEIGLSEVTFTEHLDFTPLDVSYGAFVYETWMKDIAAAREEFAGVLGVRAGVEVDFQQRFRPQIDDYLASHDFDYILGSVHYVNGVIMEDYESYFPGKTAREAYIPYFEALLTAAEYLGFDAIGHVDICKRHGSRYYGAFVLDDYRDEMTAVLEAVVRTGKVVEINTSGLRQTPSEAYPAIDTLRLYRSLGGRRVSVGSDSHLPVHLGYGLEKGISLAREAGLTVV